MVSRVVAEHDCSRVQAQAYGPQLLQEREARLGIKAISLSPVDQLAVPQAHGADSKAICLSFAKACHTLAPS